jgi:hypothetical protein
MLPGYNHNVIYKNKVYHIQTEDKGRENPNIVTLLYREGSIIASKNTNYADIIKFERLDEIVKEIMQEQHKSMLKALLNGVFDKNNKDENIISGR